ncbi:MAG TPA: helix-turn-helix transcriptional regulator [Gammaproteobacteria bacterium]|nr:helix-turn-helix transcriptional regulator [Gammaproteobacteria bacterium]
MESDDTVLQALGERLARHRLNRNQTQAQVAREAGVARRTLYKAENGLVIDTQSLVRILRALDLLDRLEALVPEPRISPMALAQTRGRVRERASGYRGKTKPDDQPAAEWTWPDED